jgi:hypothetical protein
MKREQAVNELKKVFSVLNTDYDTALAYVRKDPSQFNKRTLIRSYFALVEGLAYQLRQVTAASLNETTILSIEEKTLLSERRYTLTSNGTIESQEQFQNFAPMLLFSLRIYAKNHGAEFEPVVSDNGWNCLKQSVRIRDRLMHPKSHDNLIISDEEGEVFVSAVKWFHDQLSELFKKCDDADRRHGNHRVDQ